MKNHLKQKMRHWSGVFCLAVMTLPLQSQVVVNEIFYNAPDDLDDLQWVELYNAAEQPADLSGWTLDDGKVYTFPPSTTLGARGYLILALNTNRFAEFYSEPAQGPLKRALKRGGERLHLKDASGKIVDVARYKDRSPWAVIADGYSASLERICPTANGDTADNWAASPLPPTPRPSGTPGRQNARFSAVLPPSINLDPSPMELGPGQPLPVAVAVQGNARSVELLYRVIAQGAEDRELTLPMTVEVGSRYRGTIPPQTAGSLIRYRVKATGNDGSVRFSPDEQELRPSLSVYVHEPWERGNIPFALIIRGGSDKPSGSQARENASGFRPPAGGPGMGGRGPRPNFGGFGGANREEPRPTRGTSALVFVDQQKGVATVYDHISTVPRNNDRGFKVFFHKDHTLAGMSSVNLVFEGSEWSLLAEAMAYDVYRRAGCPAPLTDFVRVWVDGKLTGHHLMVERVNRSFLRRNGIDDSGNLYKVLWQGRDAVGQHEKRTYEKSGHGDLLELLAQLDKTKDNPDQQWEVIKANFDVDEVAGYFAVNMVLSHWDGYFNNYFTYHDPKRGKWQMYPWDQDKTWGYYDGLPDDQVFFDMPLTFGMEGDRPPGPQQTAGQREPEQRGPGGPGGFGGGRGGPRWWRAGGYFSRPLLANPHFRKVFLARTSKVVREVYTEERYPALIDELSSRLEADAVIRAKLRGEQPDTGKKMLARDAQLLKTHQVKRRQFLLEQQELSGGGVQAKPSGANAN